MIQIVSKHTLVAWVNNSYPLSEHVILHCQVTLDIEDHYRTHYFVRLIPATGPGCTWQALKLCATYLVYQQDVVHYDPRTILTIRCGYCDTSQNT